jgi:outer membrane protein assembly factor BamB
MSKWRLKTNKLVPLIGLVVMFIAAEFAVADQWPSYRHDYQRSGVTVEQISPPLSLRWTFKPMHAPNPAWYKPAEERPRTDFDSAYHVTAANSMVYFGSSVDNKVYTLKANTGEVIWTFFTGGPVRLAPSIWKNRIYAGSDDGYVYCLNASDGTLIWKYRPGPSDEKVIGNERMISLWPVRTSILVDDGVAYCGAGLFPYEGIYICALNADTGRVLWKNGNVGAKAHELHYGGMSPQGYLVASQDILYVPSGRALPAAFDRKDGRFLYYCSPPGKVGGVWSLLQDGQLIAGSEQTGKPAKITYDTRTGHIKNNLYSWFPGLDLVNTARLSYVLDHQGITALDRAEYAAQSKRVNEIEGELNQLASTIKSLKRKRGKAEEQKKQKISEKIDQATTQMRTLAQERKKLKNIISVWKYENADLGCLIAAGDTVFAGGKEKIIAVDTKTGKKSWQYQVEGKVYGLAVADGNLLVSTDAGPIYCFAPDAASDAREIKVTPNPSPYTRDKLSPVYQAAAEEIIKQANIRKGYALVLGCDTGRLAYEIAQRTELKIVGIERDPKKRDQAREYLDSAGLYGSRVVVESWDPANLPDYFANLIVCDEMIVSGGIESIHQDIPRILRPCGGVAIFGWPQTAPGSVDALNVDKLVRRLTEAGMPKPVVVRSDGVWVKMIRSKLADTGSWTHIYGNPANTACSEDQLVKSPLGVLWFGEPGPEKIVERHARPTAPVSINGRLFIQGEDVIIACDAYNGTVLWEKEIPDTTRVRVDVDGGSMAVSEEGLYLPANSKCYRLDPATGEVMRIYQMPPSPDGNPRSWRYVASTGDILFGSTGILFDWEYSGFWKAAVSNGRWKNIDEIPQCYKEDYKKWTARYPVPNVLAHADYHRSGATWGHGLSSPPFGYWGSQRSPKNARDSSMLCSDAIFATDTKTGELLWIHRGKEISHITPTIADGTIFFTENIVTEEQKNLAFSERDNLIEAGKYEPSKDLALKPEDMDVRLLIALDAQTGRKRWEKSIDLTGCGGNKMGLAYKDGILLCLGHFSNHDRPLFANNQLTWRRIIALSAGNGEVIWSRPLNYLRRPLIVGDKIIIEPWACQLRTGKIIIRSHPITHKQVPWEFLRPGHSCGVTTGSASSIFYRSYCGAFYDLETDSGLKLFGGIRPGCWVNIIPANGLLLAPESSSGCTCSFPIKCSVALKHKPQKKFGQWSVFIDNSAVTPARRLAVNFGAPGDMRDEQGKLWFGYPRPKTRYGNYGVKFSFETNIVEGMGYFCRDYQGVNIAGSPRPWLFTSGCLGLLKCQIPLIDQTSAESNHTYTVRLGFIAPSNDKVGQRVFGIKIQDKVVIDNFDVLEAAGRTDKAVIKEFTGIQVNDMLNIEFISPNANPTGTQAPVVNCLEVISEKIE